MRFWQWERKTIWKVAGALGVLVAVLIIIDAVSPKADKPAPTPTATATATSAINEDLAAIAMDSGKYVEWFLSEAQPRCNRMHGRDNCQVALWEVVLAGPCGANLGRRLEWPTELKNGPIYYLQLQSRHGVSTGWRQISSGARYDEVPEQDELLACWVFNGVLPPVRIQ